MAFGGGAQFTPQHVDELKNQERKKKKNKNESKEVSQDRAALD